MEKVNYNQHQLNELLWQTLEAERGGVRIFKTALTCALNKDSVEEWQAYLQQTLHHEQVLLKVFQELKLDPETQTRSRDVVDHISDCLIKAMLLAKRQCSAEVAQLVAGECVVLAKTKKLQHWAMIGHVAAFSQGKPTRAYRTAVDAIGQEEKHGLEHCKGQLQELWIDALGLSANRSIETAMNTLEVEIGTAHAVYQRRTMMN